MLCELDISTPPLSAQTTRSRLRNYRLNGSRVHRFGNEPLVNSVVRFSLRCTVSTRSDAHRCAFTHTSTHKGAGGDWHRYGPSAGPPNLLPSHAQARGQHDGGSSGATSLAVAAVWPRSASVSAGARRASWHRRKTSTTAPPPMRPQRTPGAALPINLAYKPPRAVQVSCHSDGGIVTALGARRTFD